MRIWRLENSVPAKPWVRRWMLWVGYFFAAFAPRVVVGLLQAPPDIIADEWRYMRSEVMSWKLKDQPNDQ